MSPVGWCSSCALPARTRAPRSPPSCDAFGARSACYVGDDLGDIAAFDALDDLRSEGLAALAVFSGAPDERAWCLADLAARADVQLAGPDAVVAFLEGLLAAVRSR